MGQQDESRTRPLEPVQTEAQIEDRAGCPLEEAQTGSQMEEVDLTPPETASLPLPTMAPALRRGSAPAIEAAPLPEPGSAAAPVVLVDGMVATNPAIERALQDETHKEKFELFISELMLNEEPAVPRSPSTQTVSGGQRRKLPLRQVSEDSPPSAVHRPVSPQRAGWLPGS